MTVPDECVQFAFSQTQEPLSVNNKWLLVGSVPLDRCPYGNLHGFSVNNVNFCMGFKVGGEMVSLLPTCNLDFHVIFQCLINWLSSSHLFSFKINDLEYKLSKILWLFWESGNPVLQELWNLTAKLPPSPSTWGWNFYALCPFSSLTYTKVNIHREINKTQSTVC